MIEQRSQTKELMDEEIPDPQVLRQNLIELIQFNRWLGGKHTLISALNKVLKKTNKKSINLVDLGCGGGDLLFAIDRWAKNHSLTIQLFGIDVNPVMIEYAKQNFNLANTQYSVADILNENLNVQTDIFCLNAVCHHLQDAEIINLLKNLKQQMQLAIVINDLRRNRFAYYAIKVITTLFQCSSLARNDAPLSVLRAFNKKELIKLLQSANIEHYQIEKSWAFRWRIIIWKEQT